MITAVFTCVGILNVYTDVYAVPPVAFDDTVSIDLGTVTYRTVNPTFNDTDVEDILDFNNIDLDPSSPGIQTSFTTLDGIWYVFDPNGIYGGEVLFQPNDFYFHSTTTVQYVTVDSNSDVSNIATITLGSYFQAPTVSNLFATGVDGARVSLLWFNSASMPGGATTDNLDLDPLTPGQQSTSTTPLGVFTHNGPYIIFQSTNGLTGVATTTYQVFNLHDGQPSNIGEVTVTINPNTPPVASDYTYGSNIYPDQEINLYVSDLATDVDQGSFYVSAIDWDLTTLGFQNELTTSEGSWTIANNDPFGFNLYFKAAANFLGTALFPFRVKDDSNISSNVATATINVINDAPLAVDDSVLTGTGVPISINVFGNDDPLGGTLADVDLDPNTAGINETSTSTPDGTFTLLVDKKVLFTPTPLFIGLVSVPYIAVDSFGERSLVPANIQVDVRDIPILQVKIGMVGSSNINTTFNPLITGPVTVTPLPTNTCPAFAGTINSAQLALQNFSSDLRVLNEGEVARGVVALENIGSAGAHTIQQRTSSFTSFASNVVCIMKGDGTVLVDGVDYDELFDGYVQFYDTPAATLSDSSVVDGSNIAFIIFDITFDSSIGPDYFLNVPSGVLTVTEALSDVANGPNVFNGTSPYRDEARVFPRRSGSTLQTVNASSTQLTTNVSSLTIGEIITYRTEIVLPELARLFNPSLFRDVFVPGIVVYDNNGLQNPIRVTASTSIIDSNTLGPLASTSQVLFGGSEIEVVFDGLYNTDTDISTVESILIEYDVIVSDSVVNTQGGMVTNSAQHTIDTSYVDPPGCSSECNSITGTVINRAATSTQVIVEPALALRSVSATTTNASSTAQFIFELFHDGSNTNDAQDVVFYLQTNGVGLTPINISDVQVTGLAPATTTIGSLFLSWPSIPAIFTSSSPITISFLGTLLMPATGTTTLMYPVGLTSWSASGGSLTPLSSFSPLSHARTYSGTSTLGTVFVPSGVLPPLSTSTPVVLPPGGGYSNPGCMDPKALNYDKSVTINNGTCKYLIATSTTTPSVAPVVSPVDVPIVAPILTIEPTYIPKNKLKKLLEITGNPRDIVNTALRTNAIAAAIKEKNSIKISGIKVSQPILQLPTLTPLLGETWILPDNSTPDKGGNTVIVGHSYSERGGKKIKNTLFDLVDLKIGEKIEVAWKGKMYVYQVFDNDQFAPNDIWLEDDTKESMITIYSCGRFTTAYRQVVRASLVEIK